ncbi:unnamed protein product [Phaedon cochleariae]|uniref:Uncharacterized protein n=1 Tax=Phaedon cochleariae TaxID=80249 RepID=A0A9N9SC14_PHACE|nr:unnamed protein product [Phaedon cochleariae]
MKFSEIIQVTREEEQLHYRKLRHQYKVFLEEDRKRQERNEKIVRSLEKIDARISRLTSKKDLYQRPRRFCRNCHHRTSVNDIPKSEKVESSFPKYEQAYKNDTTEKLDIIDEYLNSLKKKPTSLTKEDKLERFSTKQLDNLREGLNKRFDSNKANSIATEIMNSIYSRHYERDLLETKIPDITQPISKLPKNLHDETETPQPIIDNTSFPSSVSPRKCDEIVLPKDVSDISPKISSRSYYELENEPKVERRTGEVHNNIHYKPTTESNSSVNIHENKIVRDMGKDAASSKLSKLNPIEDESKIALELNCLTKENNLTGEDGSNVNDDIEQQPPEKNTETKRNNEVQPNIQVPPQQKSLGNETTMIQREENKNSQVSKPKTESLHEKLRDTPSSQTINDKQLGQSDENNPQTVNTRDDGQLVEDDNSVPLDTLGDDTQSADHHEPMYDENGKAEIMNQYDETEQQQFDENGQHIDHFQPQHDENAQVQQFDRNGQHIDQYEPQYDEKGQAIQQQQPFDENGQHIDLYEPQHDENGQVIQQQQFDRNGQDIDHYEPQYNENGQLIEHQQFDENGQHIDQYEPQYDEHGQLMQQQQFENGQHIDQYESQYDDNGQIIQQQQFDGNGQHIDQYEPQYDENGQVIHQQQYDDNGQLIGHYDETGQANPQQEQYDENGQIIQQQLYDENGQAIQYDEHGQPYPAFEGDPNLHYQQYDENGQPIQPYDQPSVAQYGDYDQSYGQYDESEKMLQGNDQLHHEEKIDLNSTGGNAGSFAQGDSSEISHDPKEDGKVDGVQNKVLDMLDTDTDSVKQNTSKISNESDFDFGSG